MKLIPPELGQIESRNAHFARLLCPTNFVEHLSNSITTSQLSGGWWVQLQELAQIEFEDLVPLGHLAHAPGFAHTCGNVIEAVTRDWAADSDPPAVSIRPAEFVRDFLGKKQIGLRRFSRKLSRRRHSDPLSIAPKASASISLYFGYGHGDLHVGNVLVPESRPAAHEFVIIDHGRFSAATPVGRDPAKLALSAALSVLSDDEDSEELAEAFVRPHEAVFPHEVVYAAREVLSAAAFWGASRGLMEAWHRQYLLVLGASALRSVADEYYGLHQRRWLYEVARMSFIQFEASSLTHPQLRNGQIDSELKSVNKPYAEPTSMSSSRITNNNFNGETTGTQTGSESTMHINITRK